MSAIGPPPLLLENAMGHCPLVGAVVMKATWTMP